MLSILRPVPALACKAHLLTVSALTYRARHSLIASTPIYQANSMDGRPNVHESSIKLPSILRCQDHYSNERTTQIECSIAQCPALCLRAHPSDCIGVAASGGCEGLSRGTAAAAQAALHRGVAGRCCCECRCTAAALCERSRLCMIAGKDISALGLASAGVPLLMWHACLGN